MGFFSHKHHFSVGKFAHKLSAKNIKKFASKAKNIAHKGLAITDKVVSTVSKVSKGVANVASKLSSVPVVGEVAGAVASGAKQVNTVAKTTNRGVKGLEKVTKKEKSHSQQSFSTIDHKSRPIVPPSSVGEAPKAKNPLQQRQMINF